MHKPLFTFFAILLSVSAFAQEGFKGQPFIEVTGMAETEIDPNEITVQIRLREFEENKNKTALEKIEQDFFAALKTAGIDRKRLRLADVGSRLSKLGKKEKDAFREKTYQLVLSSGSELETFLEKMEPVKVDLINITRVHHTDYEKIRLDLKVNALKIARSKAEVLLGSMNLQPGKPLLIRDWQDEPFHPYYEANIVFKSAGPADMSGQSFEAPTDFRKIRMRAQITAQFEIR